MTFDGVGNSGQFKTINHNGNIFRSDYENANGDVSGLIDNLIVIRLQGRPMSSLAPVNGQLLSWDGTQWLPSSGSVAISGHNLLSVTHPDTIPSAPVHGDLIVANSGGPAWAKFPAGLPGQSLTVSSSSGLEWANPASSLPTVLIVTSGTSVNLADDNLRVIVNKTIASPIDVLLPLTPTIGREIVVKDGKGDAGPPSNNFIDIYPASGITIDGFSKIRIGNRRGSYTFLWNGTEWNIV